MMTKLNNVVKVALIALTMMVGAQSASADDVTMATVVENTKAPFGFATRSSRTDSESAYSLTGGGAYTVDAIKAMMTEGGITEGAGGSATVGGKNIIVLTSDGTTPMDAEILSAIGYTDKSGAKHAGADIIVFDGSGTSTDFQVSEQIHLKNLQKKTIIGINGARLCTKWHMSDIIKSWLNSVETSSGSGVSNASTSAGTGGSITLKNVAGGDSVTIAIDEEGEYLTRRTLANRGAEADPSDGDLEWEQYYYLRNERYRKSGIFYIEGCENVIIRNLSFVGPGSVDVGGVDLVSVINSSHHIWVDHCEFIDGQDGNFDITNESDYITASWCHFHYTDRSYVHQNTNLVGSSDTKVEDTGKLNITYAYNEWGENCRSRMPMARFGKIHLLNNWYNCAGNTEYAVNPRLDSEFLVEGNYFASGVTKTFRNQGSTAVTILGNTVADPSATALAGSGSTVTVPYEYTLLASAKVPEMEELLVGPVLDIVPTFSENPDNHEAAGEDTPGYYLTVTTNRAKQGLTFSVWADHVIGYQWYKATNAELTDAVAIDGATSNSYTFEDQTETTTYLYCVATGLAGSSQSNVIHITVDGSDAIPEFATNLNEYTTTPYEAIVGNEFELAVDAGEGVTYQWYVNSVASTEDATAVRGATSATYSFTPGETERELGFQFFFCVATSESDNTLSATSNIARVIYKTGESLIDFVADDKTPDSEGCTSDLTGITLVDQSDDKVTYGTSKYNTDTTTTGCINLGSGCMDNTADGTYSIKLSTECGFKKGDVITFAGFINADEWKGSTKNYAKVLLFTLNESNKMTKLNEGDLYDCINGRISNDDIQEYSFELTEDADYLYLGRTSGTTTARITKINVYRGAPLNPYIKTNLNDESPYSVTVDVAAEFTIEAEQAQSYQWYTCTSPIDYDANKVAVEGQTTATCTITATAPGTTYLYCVVTNGAGSKAKSVNSKIATVIAKANSSGTRSVTYTWDFDKGEGKKWNGFSLDGGSAGTYKFYESVDDATQKLGYAAKSDAKSAITAKEQLIGPITWSHYLQFGGASVITSGSENRVFKYVAPYPGVITVYAGGSGKDTSVDRYAYVNTSLSTTGAKAILCANSTAAQYNYDSVEVEAGQTVYIWCSKDVRIFGVTAVLEEPGGGCVTPKAKQGAWSGDELKWTYTVSSSTETAHIHYKVNGGAEQVESDNSVDIQLERGATVEAWAVDSNGVLATSDILEFTADTDMGKAATPTITRTGSYSIDERGFPVELSVADGYTIHYTTDGTDPTAESSTYSTTIYVAPGATVKAISTKANYDISSVASEAMPDFDLTGGEETICRGANEVKSNDTKTGISYIVNGTYDAGQIDGTKTNGLKYRINQVLLENADAAEIYPDAVEEKDGDNTIYRNYGFRINVQDGFVIKRIVATDMWSNFDEGTKAVLKNVYVDGSKTGKLPEEQKNQELNYRNINPAGSIDVSGLNATDYIDFVFAKEAGGNQVRATFQLYFEVDDAPESITVTGKVAGEEDTQTINLVEDTYNYQIDKAVKMYDEKPDVVLNTASGNAYEMSSNSGDGTYTFFTKTVMGHEYRMSLVINEKKSPEAKIDKDSEGLKLYRDASGMGRGGYKVTLENIAEGATPYIKIDGGEYEQYYSTKEYYALKQVKTHIKYTDPETGDPAQTGDRTFDCPANDYDAEKPFAVFLYQSGYQDSGAGQEAGASSSSWAKAKNLDKTYLGLTDQYNVIDIVLNDDLQKQMITKVRPDIRNAQLVVLSEMIGSKTPESSSVYAASKLQDVIMSVRDSVIGYTNVLNLKMFFYSQSSNNNTRWAWAQPATLPNSVVSIMPTNPRYKVFENVVFNNDGSIQLWSNYDEESTLNRLQLVHNFNEENDDLPAFTKLATATDSYGEEYDALHFFEKNGYTYIGTGLSINDYEHYDENLHSLVSTIGDMLNHKVSLSTTLEHVPAPRIRDNGDGSATITNNYTTAVTYYRTSDNKNETWTAEQIKSNGTTTRDALTDKYSSDVWVYAISDNDGELSEIAKLQLAGNPYRYVHRTTDDAEAQGKAANFRFKAEDGEVTIPYNQSFYKPGYTVTSWMDKYNPETTYTPGQVVSTTQDLYLVAVWTKNTKKITDTNASQSDAQRTVTWNFEQTDGAPAMKLENGSTTVGQTGIIVGQMIFSNTAGDFIDVPMTINADGSATLPDNGETFTGKFDNTSTAYSDVNNDKYLTDFAQVRTGTTFTFPSVYGMEVKYEQATFEKYEDKANKVREKSQTTVLRSTLTGGTLTTSGLTGIYDYTAKADTMATLTSIESATYVTPDEGTTTKTVGALNYGSAFMKSLSVKYPVLYQLSTEVEFKEKTETYAGHINILPNKDELTDEQIKQRAVKVELSAAHANCDGRYNAGTTINFTITPGYSFYFEDDGSTNILFSADSGTLSPSIAISDNKKVATGTFTIQPNTVATIRLTQKPVFKINTGVMPLATGSVRIDSRTGKSAEDEYTMFPEDSTILIKPTPKIGYRFSKWQNDNGDEYGDGTGGTIKWPDGVTCDPVTNVITMVVQGPRDAMDEDSGRPGNTTQSYVAVFKEGKIGTVNYRLSHAGLYTPPVPPSEIPTYSDFRTELNPGEPTPVENPTKYLYTHQYPNYKFPVSRTTSALYIPTNYTLYKPGYTLRNWVYIEDFDYEKEDYKPEDFYESGVTEYNIGTYYYFGDDEVSPTRDIAPMFEANPDPFEYRHTTADITWDFRTAYMAQRLYFDTPTEFDYATHTVINENDVIDVPLHIKGIVDNTALDEWCHFDEGTVITIPSGLGAKFTFVTYHKLSSTTIDGEVPLEYTMRTENDIPVYYYTYTTHSTKTTVDLVIGKDHTYFKSIRAQLPAADHVTLTTTANNDAWGSNEVVKVNTTREKVNNDAEPSDVSYATEGNVSTLQLGSYVKVKATRNRLYELKAFVVDGDTITAENVGPQEGYTMTTPKGTGKEYTLTFRMQTYATVVEAVYGERQTWQITFSPGKQAYGEAPGVIVVEDGEAFTMPAKNQTLYREGYTLKRWVDEAGTEYEWKSEHTPTGDLFLTPVFEINDFTLFNIPSGYHAVTWPLTTGDDPTYGGAPLLKYQKSSGVYVSQLTIGGQYIDMPLNINCAETGKVDNSSTNYRCQINSGSVMTFLTNSNCRITVYTSAGELYSTKIAGVPDGKGSSYKSNAESGTVNDQYAIVTYTGDASSQTIQFTGDASYFKMVKVEYGKPKNTDNLPQLKQVTIDNIALGSYGSEYEKYLLSKLKTDKSMSIDITRSTTAIAMPKVKAEADRSDAIIEITQATVDIPTTTIILKTSKGATVAIYKLDFNIGEYVDVPAAVMQKIEMGGVLVAALDYKGDWQNYLDKETKTTMNVNGAISITFDHAMAAQDIEALGQVMKCTSTNSGKTLVFSYWGLTENREYTFTIPANTLTDAYGNDYASEISFTFRTDTTAQTIVNRKIDFVVTHKQAYTFNSANPEQNYTSGVKRQVASDDLIANLAKEGIAYGTIDEGIAAAHAAGGTDRFYIFVPNGEYQLRGNQATDAISSAPYDASGKPRNELMKSIYNGITAIKRVNLSITGQSQENTKLYNQPEIEGISYTSTFMVNSGISGFYVQDMTLRNAFDYKACVTGGSSAGRAVVLRDRGSKTIMKNVTMDSWQDTYYSNVSNKDNDTRGYFEDCTIMGYVDFICGDGDHWFERCNLMMRNGKAGNASNMIAPRTYANQNWGYVFNNCQITAEDEITYNTCNGKFTMARPWDNSPASSLLYTKFNVLPSDDGYKQMTSGGLVLRMHEYRSTDANDVLLDLNTRSLRASSPGAGSYAAVMTPAEAAEYTMQNVLGNGDGYDPTIYTKQVSMADADLTSVDRSLSWNGQSGALCYFIFRKTANDEEELFAITDDTSYELDDSQIGKTFVVRAANQRGGLGEPSNEFTYEVHESFQLTLTTTQQAMQDSKMWSWSTVYLDYNAKAPTMADDDEEADVYVYAVVNVGTTSMTLKRVDILEKNQGYIVKGKPGTYTFAYTDSDGKFFTGDLSDKAYNNYTAVKAGRMSILDGVVETTARAGKEVYTLYYKENYGLGFYTYTGQYLNANKAYLNGSYVPTEGTGGFEFESDPSSSGFIFLDDIVPTDLNKVRGSADDDSEKIYTVFGQRVKRSEMIKGRVYIINGRKIAY